MVAVKYVPIDGYVENKGEMNMQKQDIIFAWLGSILCILFFLVVNYLTNPDYLWFIYPTFFLLLWPFSMYSIKHKNLKLHSLFTSVILILFFITINYVHSPFHPWFLYASYPILWWPTLMFMGKRSENSFSCNNRKPNDNCLLFFSKRNHITTVSVGNLS